MTVLRPYQADSERMILDAYSRRIKKVILYLSTGAGKTVIFSSIVKKALAKGSKVLLVAKGVKLVQQAHERLLREGVPHGVIMGNHHFVNKRAACQVCSIDTLTARNLKPEANIIIIDECDQAVAPTYKRFLANYPEAYILGVTATPFTKEPLRHIGDLIVHPISFQQLVNEGYLIAPRFYAPSAPDLEGVKTVNTKDGRDYEQNELYERMSGLTGDLPEHWFKYAAGRPSMISAVSVKHSIELAKRFNDAGIPARHLDAIHTTGERKEVIELLVSRKISVLSQVEIAVRGVDIPELSCIISARPTKSFNFYIQLIGRETRPVYLRGIDINSREGRLAAIARGPKPDAIFLDHAGNVVRHGFPQVEKEPDLDGLKKRKKKKDDDEEDLKNKARVCTSCYAVYVGKACHECGNVNSSPRRVAEVDGELVELSLDSNDPVETALMHLKMKAISKGKSKEWPYRKLLDEFGPSRAAPYLPAWFVKSQNVNFKKFVGTNFRSLRR